MKKWFLGLLAPLFCLSTVSGIQQSSQNKSGSILIRKDRPSVYIEFERSGKAPPLFEKEKEERIWLRLHNNTQWAIKFCSFPVNNQYGGAGIVYEVKRSRISFGMHKGSSNQGALSEERNQQESVRTPQGYSTADVCNRLMKELWSFTDNRISVRFEYEWRDAENNWFRSHGNEHWEFDHEGLMRGRDASINDIPIQESERRYFESRASTGSNSANRL